MDNFKGAEIEQDEGEHKTKFDATQYSFFVMDGSDEEELGGALEEGLDAPPEEESLGGFEEEDAGLLSALDSKLDLNSRGVDDVADGADNIFTSETRDDRNETLSNWGVDRGATSQPPNASSNGLSHPFLSAAGALGAPSAAHHNAGDPPSAHVDLPSQGQLLQSVSTSSSQPTWQQRLSGLVPPPAQQPMQPPTHFPPGFPAPHAPAPRYMRGMTAEELEAQMGFAKPREPEPSAAPTSTMGTALTATELEARMLGQQSSSAPFPGLTSLPMPSHEMLGLQPPPGGPLPGVSASAGFHHAGGPPGAQQPPQNLAHILFPPSAPHGGPPASLPPGHNPGFPFQQAPPGGHPPPPVGFPPGYPGFQGQQAPPPGHLPFMPPPPNTSLPSPQPYLPPGIPPPMPPNPPGVPPGFGPGPHQLNPPPNPHQGTPPPHHPPPNFQFPPLPPGPPGMPPPSPHMMGPPPLPLQPTGTPNMHHSNLLPPHPGHPHLPPNQQLPPGTPLGPSTPGQPQPGPHPPTTPSMPISGPHHLGPSPQHFGPSPQHIGPSPQHLGPSPQHLGPSHPGSSPWQQPPVGTPPPKLPPGMFPPAPGTSAGQYHPAQFPQRPDSVASEHASHASLETTRQQLGRYTPRMSDSRPGSVSGHHHSEDGGMGHGGFRRRVGAKRMSADEIDHILRIQHQATHQGEPYVEDYYFQAFVHKHTGGKNFHVFAPEVLREFSVNGEHDKTQVKFLNLEGLGKIVLSNIKTPKVLMDVSDITRDTDSSQNTNSEGSLVKPLEKEPLLAARMMIEDCMHLLLDVDDLDRAIAASRGNRNDVTDLRQRKTLLLDAIISSFRLSSIPWSPNALSTLDGIFLRITSLSKGRVLIARTLRVLSSPTPPVSQGPTNGKRPPAAKSSNALPIVWAVLRNAYNIFGTSLVNAEPNVALALGEANAKLSASLVQAIKRLDTAEQVSACVHAFVAGTKSAVEAAGGAENPGVHLLPLSPNLPPGTALSSSSDWLGSVLFALLSCVSSGLLVPDDTTVFKCEEGEERVEVAWAEVLEGLVELLVAHVDTLMKVYESAAQGGSAAEAAQFVRTMLPKDLVHLLHPLFASKGKEAGLNHLLAKVTDS